MRFLEVKVTEATSSADEQSQATNTTCTSLMSEYITPHSHVLGSRFIEETSRNYIRPTPLQASLLRPTTTNSTVIASYNDLYLNLIWDRTILSISRLIYFVLLPAASILRISIVFGYDSNGLSSLQFFGLVTTKIANIRKNVNPHYQSFDALSEIVGTNSYDQMIIVDSNWFDASPDS